MTNNRTSRMVQTLVALHSGEKKTISELMELNNCSKSTVYRDLHELSERGVEFQYDANCKAYIVSETHTLTPPQLSYKETVLLLLLLRNAQSLLQIPCQIDTSNIEFKIEDIIPNPIWKHCREVIKHITIDFSLEKEQDGLECSIFQLLKAVNERYIVSFQYLLHQNIKTEVEVEPYHLYYFKGTWHLIGKSLYSNETTSYLLSSISEIRLSNTRFEDCSLQEMHKYLGIY